MTTRTLFVVLSAVAAIAGCQPRNHGSAAVDNGASLQPLQPTTRPAIYEIVPARTAASPGRAEAMPNRTAGAAGVSESLLGRDCRVQLRRDALGMAGAAPIGATQEWGGRVAVAGKVLELTDQWLVLQPQETGRRYCIPVASILLIEVRD